MLPLDNTSATRRLDLSKDSKPQQVLWNGKTLSRLEQTSLNSHSTAALNNFFKEHPNLEAFSATPLKLAVLDRFFVEQGEIRSNLKEIHLEEGFEKKIPEGVINLLRHGIKIKGPADVSKGLLATALVQINEGKNKEQHLEVIELVLKTGSFNPLTELVILLKAIFEDPTHKLWDLIDPLLQCPTFDIGATINGMTLLHLACYFNNLYFVHRILHLCKAKIDLNQTVGTTCSKKELRGLIPIEIAERRRTKLKQLSEESKKIGVPLDESRKDYCSENIISVLREALQKPH